MRNNEVDTSQLDLRELLSFRPRGGEMQFLGQRVFLNDILTHGILKLELINSVGEEAARRLLTRTGFARGWLAAERLKRHFPDAWAEARNGKLGPTIASMYGYGEVISSKRTDGLNGKPLVETYLICAFEAEQHLRVFGDASDVACWEHVGFASGYVSQTEQRMVCFIETHCQAKGDRHCRIVGKYLEEWDQQFAPFAHYYEGIQLDKMEAQLYDLLKWDRELPISRVPLAVTPPSALNPVYPISQSPVMNNLMTLAKSVAAVNSSVLITGESGVGKDRLVQFIHQQSSRAEQPMVAINCGALTESLIEGELFGYVKGAFTGADDSKTGLIAAADGGTLFLDEIGELPLRTQVKLLRVLQEREVRRVGDTQSQKVDIRLISATNQDLEQAVADGRFRQDLYYRVKVIELQIPPLRQRTEDILPLCRFYLARFNQQLGRSFSGFHHSTADRLLSYPWPGNVRELVNAIERAVVLGQQPQVMPQDLPQEIANTECKPSTIHGIRAMHDIEKEHILATLEKLDNKTMAAEALGMSVATLYRKLKAYGYEH